jgi:hypothetical protein
MIRVVETPQKVPRSVTRARRALSDIGPAPVPPQGSALRHPLRARRATMQKAAICRYSPTPRTSLSSRRPIYRAGRLLGSFCWAVVQPPHRPHPSVLQRLFLTTLRLARQLAGPILAPAPPQLLPAPALQERCSSYPRRRHRAGQQVEGISLSKDCGRPQWGAAGRVRALGLASQLCHPPCLVFSPTDATAHPIHRSREQRSSQCCPHKGQTARA